MSAGAKRSSEDEPNESVAKKSRVDTDALSSVTVYQPNTVISELSKKMNSLVEVRVICTALGHPYPLHDSLRRGALCLRRFFCQPGISQGRQSRSSCVSSGVRSCQGPLRWLHCIGVLCCVTHPSRRTPDPHLGRHGRLHR